MRLNEIADNSGARKTRKRVGRGIGSGLGKTGGRGVKGQKSRSGVAIKGFEGGQMPIHRRLPKRGFNNYNRIELESVNIGRLQRAIDEKKLDASKPITIASIIQAGLANGKSDGIKILGTGELKTKIIISADSASKTAIDAIEKAGGKFSVEEKTKKEPKTSKKDNKKSEEKPSPKKTTAKKSTKK